MLKRALFLLMVMLTVPTIASAMNYWSISATTSPSSIGSAITRPSGAGFSTLTGSTTTNVTSSTITEANFDVAPTSGAYTLSYVLIDGVKTPPVSGSTYRVFKGSKINHSLSAVYAVQKYTITTSKVGTGLVDPPPPPPIAPPSTPSVSVTAGSSKAIYVVAGLGYQISSVTKADGSPIDATYTGDTQSRVYTFANISENKTLKATFTVVPVVDARISTPAQTIAANTPLVIDGSTSTSSVGTTTNSWSVVGSPATASVTETGATTTFNATAPGTYTVRLDASAGGASDFATLVITVETATALQAAVCTACHNDFSPDVIAAWNANLHGTNSATCQSCHQNGGHVSSHADSAGGNGGYTQLIAQNSVGHEVAAGSNSCLTCHFDVADWSNTPHTGKAQVGKENVLGYNADPALYTRAAAWITANRYTYLHPKNQNADGTVKDASKLGIRAIMTEKPEVTYSEQTFGVDDIAICIGSNYKQAYAVWMPGYGYKILNIRYNKIGLSDESMGERTDERVWEGSCIGCHLTGYDPTNLDPDYKDAAEPYDLNPYIGDMRVGCEACHGPIAGGTVNPSNLTQEQQIDICGRCHGNWNPTVPGTTARKDVPEFKPGDSLVELLSPAYNGGVDRLMRPVWGTTTKAFQATGAANDDHEQWYDFKIGNHYGKQTPDGWPVVCTSCHDPHDNVPGRRYGRRILKGEYDYTPGTSTVCASCHPDASFVVDGKTVTRKGVSGALNPHTGKPYGVGVVPVPTDPSAKWPWEEQ